MEASADHQQQVVSPAPSARGKEQVLSKGKHAKRYRSVYNGFFGFYRPYNFSLWVIFSGGLLGFSLSRLYDLDYDGIFKNQFALVAGYWYHFGAGRERIGMIMHLACILPAGILVVLQFVPIIRHKLLIFHRVNGYVVILLSLISGFATCAVIPHKQGGGSRISTQTAEAFLVISTTSSIAIAWWAIQRKRIDRHRAFMLRNWALMGTIITSRLLNLISSPVISRIGGWYGVWKCDEINFLYTGLALPFPETFYPQCVLGNGTIDAERRVAVEAVHSLDRPEQYGTSHIQPFGANLWLCIVIHIIAVELYLGKLPAEAARLREISQQKRLEAGFE